VRSSWGNRGEAVTSAQVAKVRKTIAPADEKSAQQSSR
jgi:hypothetical protein